MGFYIKRFVSRVLCVVCCPFHVVFWLRWFNSTLYSLCLFVCLSVCLISCLGLFAWFLTLVFGLHTHISFSWLVSQERWKEEARKQASLLFFFAVWIERKLRRGRKVGRKSSPKFWREYDEKVEASMPMPMYIYMCVCILGLSFLRVMIKRCNVV